MCAWLSTTASMEDGSKGKSRRLRSGASAPPWIMPQSSSRRRPAARTMWQEPVTSPAAPKNSSCMRGDTLTSGPFPLQARFRSPSMSDPSKARIDRRHFLIGGAVIGAGLYVGIRMSGRFGSEPVSKNTFQPNAYLRVAPDNSVTVVIGKSEMGQGIYTGLAMAVAEELDVDPKRVQVEFGPVDPAFNVPFAPVQF